jgi:hypothetical protein
MISAASNVSERGRRNNDKNRIATFTDSRIDQRSSVYDVCTAFLLQYRQIKCSKLL